MALKEEIYSNGSTPIIWKKGFVFDVSLSPILHKSGHGYG